VAAGSATFGTNQDFAIARYNLNGTPDLSFGTGGRATIDIAGDFDEARALVLQGGRLVAAGFTFTGDAATGDFAMARFTAAGRPDGTFGTGGQGHHRLRPGPLPAQRRPDASFGTGGTTTTDFARREDRAQALVVQSGRPGAVGSSSYLN
jgi:uncharacterized delta-60 repeat protein